MMFGRVVGGVLASALVAVAAPSRSAELELRDVVARVVVINEARSDVKVSVLQTNPKLPLRISNKIDGVLIDGRKDGWFSHLFGAHASRCPAVGPHGPHIEVFGVGDLSEDQLPSLVIHMPLAARISSGGAVIGSLPAADSLDLHIAGCDLWTIGHVKGRFALEDAGTGRVHLGDAGSVEAHLSGAGDIKAQSIADGLQVHIAGASTVRARQVSGPIDVHIAGQGDVILGAGHASRLGVDIAGQGDVTYGGVADTLDVHIAGQGDVRVAQVTGDVSKSIAGQGSVTIGGVDRKILGAGFE